MRFVVDTNVVISGMLFGGKPKELLLEGFARNFVWVCSEALLNEYQKVLCAKKFKLTAHEIENFMAPIIDVIEIIVPTLTIDIIKRCPGDNRVLECAVAGNAHCIVTGDRKDLLSIHEYDRVRIIQVKEALLLL